MNSFVETPSTVRRLREIVPADDGMVTYIARECPVDLWESALSAIDAKKLLPKLSSELYIHESVCAASLGNFTDGWAQRRVEPLVG